MNFRRVLYKKRFNRPIKCIKFSPDGKHFALTKENSGKTNILLSNLIYFVINEIYELEKTLKIECLLEKSKFQDMKNCKNNVL